MKSKLDNYTANELQKLLDTSNSYSDVLRKIDMNPLCGSRDTLKRRINMYDLSTEMLDVNRKNYAKDNMIVNRSMKKDYTTDLCENSTIGTTSIRRWIIKHDILEYKCDICNNIGTHNGTILKLQLDHIDGCNNNHSISNLRWLCPNCHSQTPTFSRRKSVKNKCIDCGEIIHKRSVRCASCAQIKNNSKISKRPSKGVLRNDILSSTFVAIGEKYNVSDNAVRKWCKFYNLPHKASDLKNGSDDQIRTGT